jgi:cyanophycinase
MAIGGAEDKVKERQVLTAFLELAQGRQACIAVIPAASTQADRVGNLYQTLFGDLGAAAVEVIHISSRLEAQDAGRVATLNEATAIFLSGGDQLRLATLLGGTAVAQAIRRRNAAGVVVGGTSAGAAILANI